MRLYVNHGRFVDAEPLVRDLMERVPESHAMFAASKELHDWVLQNLEEKEVQVEEDG